MASFNKVIIAGNLTREPESVNASIPICKLSIAINERKKDNTGNYVDSPIYVDVKFFNKSVDFIMNYLHKGSSVIIDGKLAVDTWEDKETGKKRSRTYVVGFSCVSTDKVQRQQPQAQQAPVQPPPPFPTAPIEPPQQAPAPAPAPAQPQQQQSGAADAYFGGNDTMDEIPF